MSCGAPTRCGPARRNGRSRACAASRFPRTMRKKYGFAELGPADGPVKRAIFGETSAKMYRYDVKKAAWRDDRFAEIKSRVRTPRPRSVEFALRLRASRLTRAAERRQTCIRSWGPNKGEQMKQADHWRRRRPAEGRRRLSARRRAVGAARPAQDRAAQHHQGRHAGDVDQPDPAAAAVRQRQGRAAGHAGRARQRMRQAARPDAGIHPHRVRHHDPGPRRQALGHDQHRHLLDRGAVEADVHGALRAGGDQLPRRQGQSAGPQDGRRSRRQAHLGRAGRHRGAAHPRGQRHRRPRRA